MAREVTNCIITNLVAVGSIYQYLCQNWHLKQIRVDLTFPHAGEDMTLTERILNPERVEAIYKLMLDKWKNGHLRVVITETDGP